MSDSYRPLISVVIPIYNVEKYLEQCLDSVINQTYKNIEIICVNDCSTDNSAIILEKYAKLDSRIVIVNNKKNIGLGLSRNEGIKIANGEFIHCLDSDDWIELNAYEICVNVLNSTDKDIDVLKFAFYCHNEKTKKTDIRSISPYNLTGRVLNIDSKPEVLKTWVTCAWSKIMRKDFIFENNLFYSDRRCYEDVNYSLYVLERALKIFCINNTLLHYRENRKSSIMSMKDSFLQYVIEDTKLAEEIGNKKNQTAKNYIMNYIYDHLIRNTYDAYLNNFIGLGYARQILSDYIDYDTLIKGETSKYYISLYNGMLHGNPFFFKNIQKIKRYIKNNTPFIMDAYIKCKKLLFYNYNKLQLKQKYTNLENKIVFANFVNRGYGCNPKYIANELIAGGIKSQLVWLTDTNEVNKTEFPKEIRLVQYDTKEALKELATAKVWVSNQRMNYYLSKGLSKNKKQLYIQTWHGSLGIKKANNKNFKEWNYWSKIDSKYIDYMLSDSNFDDYYFRKDFWYKGNIIKTGHPRNDIFFYDKNVQKELVKKTKAYFNIENNTKIVLYVPTFRDNSNFSLNINTNNILEQLTDKFGGKWEFMIKVHPNDFNKLYIPNTNNVINASSYSDIQELLLASDCLISDYSSCMFDFMLSKKPVFIYAPDKEDYIKERGLYYPLEETPFSIADNIDDLKENIINYDSKNYIMKVESFLDKKDCIENGTSSAQIAEYIERFLDNNLS